MAATVFLSESNGAGQVVTDNISNINMGSVDMVNLTPSIYPIVIPSVAATETPRSSYVKFLRIKLSSLGGSNNITNLKFWKSFGVLKTGETILSNCDDTGNGTLGRFLRTTYHTPFFWKTNANQPAYMAVFVANAVPTTGNVSIDANGTADDGGVDTVSGSLTSAGYSQYFVLAELIASTAPAGAVNQKTFSFQWDES